MIRTRIFLLGIVAGLGLTTLSGSQEIAHLREAPSDDILQAIQLSLGLPMDLARVTDASFFQLDQPPNYVLIQDVHKHPEVQAHITSIILYAYDHWGATKVFVEGAVSKVDMSLFHRLPDQTRNLLMARLVNDGDLSGPETAAVLLMEREWRNPPVSPFQMVGIEDARLYRDNLMTFKEVQAGRERALFELTQLRHRQDLSSPNAVALSRQFDRAENLLRLKLTPDEYDAYRLGKASLPMTRDLEPTLRSAERFYRLAELRSEAFLQMAEKKVPASPGPRILVVGGFHTPLMAAQLRSRSLTYIVLTPLVTQGGNTPLYEKRMMDSISALQASNSDRKHNASN